MYRNVLPWTFSQNSRHEPKENALNYLKYFAYKGYNYIIVS